MLSTSVHGGYIQVVLIKGFVPLTSMEHNISGSKKMGYVLIVASMPGIYIGPIIPYIAFP